MTPSDLAAIRALVEAVVFTKPNGARLCLLCLSAREGHSEACIVPAAQEALERVEKEIESYRQQIIAGVYDAASVGITLIRTDKLDDLKARLARLEEALIKYGQHSPRCPVWATMTRGTCTCGLDTAVEGRDE